MIKVIKNISQDVVAVFSDNCFLYAEQTQELVYGTPQDVVKVVTQENEGFEKKEHKYYKCYFICE